MKHVTITLDDEDYERAQEYAAALKTDLDVLLKAHLLALTQQDRDRAQLIEEGKQLRTQVSGFRAMDLLSRDELHERKR
ncbi:MAG TPA: hypothetical protein DCL54_15165 [Alphaproteobacteria bacterium]|nr:hypothetical protein [Alphaproteobacteria bacterium]HAJ47911.1 hypothetical protein [Alphaproteobacteria bacterium]